MFVAPVLPELKGSSTEQIGEFDLYRGSCTPRHYRGLVRARVNQALQRHGLPIPDDTTSDKFPLLGRRSSVTERPH